jgi:hypothetical protein
MINNDFQVGGNIDELFSIAIKTAFQLFHLSNPSNQLLPKNEFLITFPDPISNNTTTLDDEKLQQSS